MQADFPTYIPAAKDKPLNLKSTSPRVFWDENDGVMNKLRDNPRAALADMADEEIIHLIKELDRRFVQLWDKVAFERVHELTDYGRLRVPVGGHIKTNGASSDE